MNLLLLKYALDSMAWAWYYWCTRRPAFTNNLIHAIFQGVVGSLLIKLNVQVAIYRRNSYLADWPVLEVVCVSAITAGISYLVSPISNRLFT